MFVCAFANTTTTTTTTITTGQQGDDVREQADKSFAFERRARTPIEIRLEHYTVSLELEWTTDVPVPTPAPTTIATTVEQTFFLFKDVFSV